MLHQRSVKKTHPFGHYVPVGVVECAMVEEEAVVVEYLTAEATVEHLLHAEVENLLHLTMIRVGKTQFHHSKPPELHGAAPNSC